MQPAQQDSHRQPGGSRNRDESRKTLARYALYTVVLLLLTRILHKSGQLGYVRLFRENGPVESCQLGVLLATCLYLLLEAWRIAPFRQLLFVLAGLVLLAGGRELDLALTRLIPVCGWKCIFLALFWLTGRLLLSPRHREDFRRQARAFVRSQPFALLWTACIVAIPLAQMVGHAPFLRNLLGDAYTRDFKCMIEETLELAGYLFLLAGCIETARWCRRGGEETAAG